MKPIRVARPCFVGNEERYVLECLESTWISSQGRFIEEFERQFAAFCNVRHAVSCNNGTAALHLALMAHGVSGGDEVLVPTLTYVATANAVTYCGAKPVFVDSEPETWNIDPRSIEKAVTAQTKGIIVVHLYGHPVDMDPILEVASRHNLFVIEDAAEAHGARYRGRVVGSIGHTGTFSFFGNKIMTSGEGGAVVTNDDQISAKVRLLKGQGMDPDRRYWFPIVGYNYRMTNVEAALALAQLEKFDWHFGRRREIARSYLSDLEEVQDKVELPVERDWARHAFWMFTIVLKGADEARRDLLIRQLAEDDIETRPVFYPVHTLPPYWRPGAFFPVATSIASRGINLPTHGALEESDVARVCDRVKYHLWRAAR